MKRPGLPTARPGDWPLTVRLVALCIGVTGALAVGLTAMGYVQAAQGLAQQAEATLASDALVVTTSIDDWAVGHLRELETLARAGSVRRVLEAGSEEMSAQIEEMSAQAQQLADTAEQLEALVARFRVEQGVVELEARAEPVRRAA